MCVHIRLIFDTIDIKINYKKKYICYNYINVFFIYRYILLSIIYKQYSIYYDDVFEKTSAVVSTFLCLKRHLSPRTHKPVC